MRHATGRKLTTFAFAAVLALGAAAHDAAAQGKPPTTTAPAGKPPTAAGAKPADAKAHYQAGEAKYKAGDFAGALPEFQAADAVKTTPHAQRYIGLCQDNLGHYADAVTAYQNFLADVPPKLQKEGDEIKARVAAIKAMPGKVHVDTTPPGASVTVDGKPGGVTPTDVDLAPGKHSIHLDLAGYMATDKDVDVTFASRQDVKTELAAKPAEPVAPPPVAVTPPPPKPVEPPPPPPKSHSVIPAIVTGSLAVVSAGVGVVMGILALSDKSDFDKNPTADTADSGENKALVADMAFGVAITLGVTCVVLLLSKDDDTPKTATALPHGTKSGQAPKKAPKPFTLSPGGSGAVLRF